MKTHIMRPHPVTRETRTLCGKRVDSYHWVTVTSRVEADCVRCVQGLRGVSTDEDRLVQHR